jgi:hypothetical protein
MSWCFDHGTYSGDICPGCHDNKEPSPTVMNHLQNIGGMVIEEAEQIFTECGSPDDFCIQCSVGYSVVFGGLNRLLWTSKGGFKPDRCYCSKRFLENWDEKFGKEMNHA